MADASTDAASWPWRLDEVHQTVPEFTEVSAFVSSHRDPFIEIYPCWNSVSNLNVGSVCVRRVRKFVPKDFCEPNARFENNCYFTCSARQILVPPTEWTKWLFHGTRRPAEDIARDSQAGLDFRFAANSFMLNRFDKFYGHGLYLADALDYSHQFARPLSGCGTKGQTSIIVCEAFLGNCKDFGTERRKDLKRPPEGFDSVCGTIQDDSKMYTIYDICQVRPLYDVQYEFNACRSTFHVAPSFWKISALSYTSMKPLLSIDAMCEFISFSKTFGKSSLADRLAQLLQDVFLSAPLDFQKVIASHREMRRYLLKHSASAVQHTVFSTLRGESILNDEAVNELCTRTKDPDASIRINAVDTLASLKLFSLIVVNKSDGESLGIAGTYVDNCFCIRFIDPQGLFARKCEESSQEPVVINDCIVKANLVTGSSISDELKKASSLQIWIRHARSETNMDLVIDALIDFALDESKERKDPSIYKGPSLLQPPPIKPNLVNSQRMFLVGDSNVGKSGMILRLCSGSFHEKLPSTVGVEGSHHRDFDEGSPRPVFLLEIGGPDHLGQHQARSLIRADSNDCAAVVYDCTSVVSLDSVLRWMRTLTPILDASRIAIVANKCDLAEEPTNAWAIDLSCKKLEIKLIKMSAKTGAGENDFRTWLRDQAYDKLDHEAKWISALSCVTGR